MSEGAAGGHPDLPSGGGRPAVPPAATVMPTAASLAPAAIWPVADPGPSRPAHPPGTGFDGTLVAAIGTVLTVGGWLLLLAWSRRQRRRSR